MTSVTQAPAAPETGRLSFSDLPGWSEDDLEAALGALRLGDPSVPNGPARTWFEATFRPGAAVNGHFTGYYEPELDASLTPSAEFSCPIHALPDGGLTMPRAQIEPHLESHEIAWLRDPVDRFFLQVQGSGRLRLPDGSSLRVGYAGRNGQPYVSVGKLLVERGVFGADITADDIKMWLREDPARGAALMNQNPSYVMFRVVDTVAERGPMGTLCPVTPLRSIAVDPAHTPLGTPVWIATEGHARLCIAQDTGSAIKGPGRADLFHGTGDAAGQAAGALNHPGQFIPLVRR